MNYSIHPVVVAATLMVMAGHAASQTVKTSGDEASKGQVAPSAAANQESSATPVAGEDTEGQSQSGKAADDKPPIDSTKKPETKPTTEAKEDAKPNEVRDKHGDKISYGLTLSLLRYRVTRDRSRPGRERDYQPSLDFVPPQIGFQVTVSPNISPMRQRLDGKYFQWMSVGGMLLTEPRVGDTNHRTSLTLAAVVSFLEDTIGFGVGFDMYRAIPIRAADGKSGPPFANTGLLSWATSRSGEVTAENLSFLVTFNAATIATLLSGSTGGGTK